MKINFSKILKSRSCRSLLIIGSLICFRLAFAASEDLTTVVERAEGQILSIARLLVLLSYVAGVGFAMAGVLQFKAHKDNPQQVPLSKPIVYICVAALLLFLPSLMSTAGKSVFGQDSSNAPDGAIDLKNIKQNKS